MAKHTKHTEEHEQPHSLDIHEKNLPHQAPMREALQFRHRRRTFHIRDTGEKPYTLDKQERSLMYCQYRREVCQSYIRETSHIRHTGENISLIQKTYRGKAIYIKD